MIVEMENLPLENESSPVVKFVAINFGLLILGVAGTTVAIFYGLAIMGFITGILAVFFGWESSSKWNEYDRPVGIASMVLGFIAMAMSAMSLIT